MSVRLQFVSEGGCIIGEDETIHPNTPQTPPPPPYPPPPCPPPWSQMPRLTVNPPSLMQSLPITRFKTRASFVWYWPSINVKCIWRTFMPAFIALSGSFWFLFASALTLWYFWNASKQFYNISRTLRITYGRGLLHKGKGPLWTSWILGFEAWTEEKWYGSGYKTCQFYVTQNSSSTPN